MIKYAKFKFNKKRYILFLFSLLFVYNNYSHSTEHSFGKSAVTMVRIFSCAIRQGVYLLFLCFLNTRYTYFQFLRNLVTFTSLMWKQVTWIKFQG
jgi:hypothetical protein